MIIHTHTQTCQNISSVCEKEFANKIKELHQNFFIQVLVNSELVLAVVIFVVAISIINKEGSLVKVQTETK